MDALRLLRTFSKGAAVLGVGLGFLALAGWVFHIEWLTSYHLAVASHPATVLALILGGGALWCHAALHERAAADQRQAEQALRDSEALYHSLVETLPINVLRKDLAGRVTFGNQRYSQTLGIPLAELVGKTDFDLFPRSLAEKYVADDRRVAATGQVFEDIEEHQRPGGTRLYMHVMKAPVYDAEARIIGTQILFWDETQRKLAEEALARTTSELERSNQELERFAYVASHDLQEPLRTIASFTGLLARRYQDRLDAEAQEFIQFTVQGALRMQRLIADLLAYSRVGTKAKSLVATHGEAILKAALENLNAAVLDSGARVTHDPLPTILADEVQLIQVFQNLIGNALKFRRAEAPRVHVGVERQSGTWIFRVQDNGIGIDPQFFKRLFLIFQRLHTRDEYPGTGIGLAVCKKIVERHGGRIWVDSVPEQGSTFFFSIPVLETPAPGGDEKQLAEHLRNATLRP
jgi:PAS domain S-box-containing protein